MLLSLVCRNNRALGRLTPRTPGYWFGKSQRTRHFATKDDETRIKFTEEDRMRIYNNTSNVYLHGVSAEELRDSTEEVKRVFRAENATPNEILKNKLLGAVKKFQKSPLDTGSAGVQCACMSERIIVVMSHCKQFTRDTKAGRYLEYLIQKRRTMLNYLMRTDYHYYKWVCMEYAIPEVFPANAHHLTNFRGQKNGTAGI